MAEVKVGLNNNITAEITEGLNEGDRVVAGANVLASTRSGGTGGGRTRHTRTWWRLRFRGTSWRLTWLPP